MAEQSPLRIEAGNGSKQRGTTSQSVNLEISKEQKGKREAEASNNPRLAPLGPILDPIRPVGLLVVTVLL
jgi:hypothetical protein